MRMTGVQRSACEIVSRLVADKEGDFRLVSPGFEGESTTTLPVERRGHVRVGHLWEQLELPRITRQAGKDAVLYSPMTSGPLAVSRQVVTVHDLFPVEHPEWFSRAFGSWYRWLWPRLLKRAGRVVTNSRYTRQRVLERYGLPEEKVLTCYFAQDERFRPSSPEEVSRLRAALDLPERYLLYIGSIEPRKNLKTLAAAWRRTRGREEGVHLVVAGGAARKAVFNAAGTGAESLKDPAIRLLGYVEDEHLPALYSGAQAFALPSLAEGFGLPVLEAMACGTPVICSDNTVLPEVSGGAARLAPATEVEAWVEALDDVLSDPALRRRMAASGVERAARFSWSTTAREVRSVLETL